MILERNIDGLLEDVGGVGVVELRAIGSGDEDMSYENYSEI